MGSIEEKQQRLQIPSIDFKGLDPSHPTGPDWESARTGVIAALESYGCFDAVFDGVGPELREALFSTAMPEVFRLPIEAKQRNKSNNYLGYLGKITDVAYESVRVQDANNRESVERFASMLWPEGNQGFCDTISSYAQRLVLLEQMVQRMIFQGMGIEKHCQSHLQSLIYGVRLSEYGDLQDTEARVSLPAHRDPNLITIVRQNGIEGLDVQTKDGEWVRVAPSPDSFTVMIGEATTVLTNGRLRAAVHRVSVDRKRYSAMVGSFPKEGYIIQTPQEIVDKEHPLQYNPLNVNQYLEFLHSQARQKVEDPLKAFCGVGTIKTEA